MVIKVCGIKYKDNIDLVSTLEIEMIGLNFYEPSIRYVGNTIHSDAFDTIKPTIKKVGVFVNESIEKIKGIATLFNLDYIQLHGNESIDFCTELSMTHDIIKVFRVDDSFTFDSTIGFECSKYFLFDTNCKNYGGSGKKFKWERLNQYTGDIDFLLSGGIGPNDAEELLSFAHPRMIGIDINSKFEDRPAHKSPRLIKSFIQALKS